MSHSPTVVTLPEERKGKHSYGWRRDTPDFRDLLYRTVTPAEAATLPPHTDVRPTCPPIVDQGQLGSCTGNGIAAALGFLENKDNINPNTPFSRLFIYYNERVIEGTVSSDSGAEIRDGINSLTNQGCCYESTWPYDITQFAVQPPATAYIEGAQHLILQYQRITDINQMKACLASGYPFVFGITVYESFESDTVASTGVVPMPANTESVLGGHCIVAVGYDDSTQTFIFRNSWGTSWGQAGYGTIPYAYLTNPNLASDFWYITKGQGE